MGSEDKKLKKKTFVLSFEVVVERSEPNFFWATRTWLFKVGYVPDPTWTRPYETKHKIWNKMCMIRDKIPDFLGTQIQLFGIPTLLDPTWIRLFTILSIRYPTFCYPLHHYFEVIMHATTPTKHYLVHYSSYFSPLCIIQ